MGKNEFTKEQIERLKENHYVQKVNEKQIVFTHEFRELCLIEYAKGVSPKEIFDTTGIGYHELGGCRVYSCIQRFKKQSQREEGFERIPGSGRPKNKKFETADEENRYLKDQIEYLKQENEFLKKLKALEVKYQRKKNTK